MAKTIPRMNAYGQPKYIKQQILNEESIIDYLGVLTYYLSAIYSFVSFFSASYTIILNNILDDGFEESIKISEWNINPGTSDNDYENGFYNINAELNGHYIVISYQYNPEQGLSYNDKKMIDDLASSLTPNRKLAEQKLYIK